MPPIEGRVVFDDVWAEYEPGQPVLRDVNLTAEPGQMIAIVGPTGAGKTTIINLIPRFYDVTGGRGHDRRPSTCATSRPRSLRAQIGIVLQDSFLFSDTVMNNIRYGRPDATDEEVIAAARLARADTFIERLPERLPDRAGRARQRPEPGPAPAARHRARRAGRPAHPDPRRGHLVAWTRAPSG